jgi:hypothetical protein
VLNPTPIELLGQVADTLAATVLPELDAGPARDELHAGIAMIRRIARCLPLYRQFLHDDIADMAAALRAMPSDAAGPAGQAAPAGGGLGELVDRAGALAPTVEPIAELVALDLDLRAAVADLAPLAALAALAADPGATPSLVPLLARMTEREAALRLSPWER